MVYDDQGRFSEGKMEQELVSGTVESLVYAAEEGGFTVARIQEKGSRDLTTIVGALPGLQVGEMLLCRGTWKHHATYGKQFCVESFETKQPTDLVGIQKYLESGLIKGIGPAYAKRIVEKFGVETLTTIDATPNKLLEVEGIGRRGWKKSSDAGESNGRSGR